MKIRQKRCPSADGNKTIQLKVKLPAKLKADLQVLADKKYKPMSEYARQVIVTHLLGNR